MVSAGCGGRILGIEIGPYLHRAVGAVAQQLLTRPTRQAADKRDGSIDAAHHGAVAVEHVSIAAGNAAHEFVQTVAV